MKRIRLVLAALIVVASGSAVALYVRMSGSAIGAPSDLELQVAGTDAIPGDAAAAIVQLTAARASNRGYMTAWPCDEDQPFAASLNFEPGAPTSNTTIVALDPDGKLCLSRSVDVEVIVDVNGYIDANSSFHAFSPARLHDTRDSAPLVAGETLRVRVGGRGAVPDGAAGASLNLAAVRPESNGYLIAWSCDAARPTAASLNFRAGANVSNTTQLALSHDGDICVWTSETTHVVVDVNGAISDVDQFAASVPQRLLDTRPSTRVEAGEVVQVPIPGSDGADASAIVNVAAAQSGGIGYVTAWSCDGEPPFTSVLNFDSSAPWSNSTIVGVGESGSICLTSSVATDLVVDHNGSISIASGTTPITPRRLLDTRTTSEPGGSGASGGGSGSSGSGGGPLPPISQPPTSSADFTESFDTPDSLGRFDFQVHHRSDHDPGIGFPATANDTLSTDTWNGDHDQSCGGPTTSRTLNAQNRSGNIYWCKEHVMTSMGQVDGYSTIAFSPKQVFTSVSRVCWDQNVTDLGGRQWTEVVITPADSNRTGTGQPYLAHTNPGTEETVDPTAALHVPSTFGVRVHTRYDGLTVWHQRTDLYKNSYYFEDGEGYLSRAIRRQHCIVDNGNGTVSIRIDQGTRTTVDTTQGSLPDNARVIFEDHNYTPDKDGEACREHDGLTGCRYTWHWDNVIVET